MHSTSLGLIELDCLIYDSVEKWGKVPDEKKNKKKNCFPVECRYM